MNIIDRYARFENIRDIEQSPHKQQDGTHACGSNFTTMIVSIFMNFKQNMPVYVVDFKRA